MFNKKPAVTKELSKAGKLLIRLFSIRIVQIFFAFIIFLLVTPIIVFFVLKPEIQHDINYGITFSNKYATQMGLNWKEVYIKILDELQVKNLRLVAYWDDIESEKDVYNYNDIKWQVEEAQKRGVSVILSMGRKVPRYPECFEPTWWKQLPSDSLREQELLDYLKITVNEFKKYDNIKIWQVENEPFWPFGTCSEPDIKKPVVEREIELVKSMDPRPILVQDSGEGGLWKSTYEMGDYLGISMYRKIWYDFWGIFFGKFIYFQYPLSHWTYKIKANIVGVPVDKIIITELQGEPWGPGLNSTLTQEDKNQTMSRTHFLSTIAYAQKSGFKDLYLWGAEWWYWEMTQNNNHFYWETAKALFK